jgi:hypothetical protein
MMMGYPQIGGGTDDFFTSVIKVVSERANLRFEFENGKQAFIVNDKRIPILCGSEEPW